MDVALFLFSSRTLLSTRCLLSSLVSCGLLHLYPCTLVHLYPCTLVHLYPCTLVHLYPCAMRRRPARRQRLEPKTAADITACGDGAEDDLAGEDILLPLLAEDMFTYPMVSCSILVSAPLVCHLCSPPYLGSKVQLSCGTPVSLLPL